MARKQKLDPTLTGPQVLAFPQVGEEIELHMQWDTFTQPVAGPCPNSKGGHWYCITHREHFENQFGKDVHINHGQHKMVWICHEHGPEVDPKWSEQV